MVYFDNAATSRPKPDVVTAAFMEYVQNIGTSPGRGSYSLGISASRMLFQSRKAVTDFFGCSQKTNVVFTKNSTEAINLFLDGYLQSGDHVLISPFEHNAVLRPLHYLSLHNDVKYDVLSETAMHDVDVFKKALLPNTKLVCITLASNLTGEIIYNRALGQACAMCHIPVFVDASQGGGKMLIKMQDDYIDYLRFLYNGIIIKHQKTEPTYTKTSLFLCEKRRFFMARREKGVVPIIYFEKERGKSF